MRRRSQVLIAVAFAAALVAVITIRPRAPEPRYQGRSLSDWLQDTGDSAPESDLSAAGVRAVRAIGTNAIPTALHWISYQPSAWDQKLRTLRHKLPRPLQPHTGPSGPRRAADAERVFAILGPQARTAIPELVHLAITSSDPPRALIFIDSLCRIGPDALPGILTIVTNTQAKGRDYAIRSLRDLGTNLVSAVPVLIRCLDDKDDDVACAAAYVLIELALLPATTVPALKNAFHSANAHRRAYIIEVFAGFGAAAKPDIPELQAALFDSSPVVRLYARNILLEVAPEALTNAVLPLPTAH